VPVEELVKPIEDEDQAKKQIELNKAIIKQKKQALLEDDEP